MGEAAQHPGTTHAGAWLRRSAAAVAGAAVMAGVVPLGTAQAAPAPAAASPSGSGAATVTVDAMTPVAKQGSRLKITGTVSNDSSEPIKAGHVGVRVGTDGPVSSRSAMSGTAASGELSYQDGQEIAHYTAKLPDIAPHVSRPFTLDMPVKALGLGANGVYRLAVTASGTTKNPGYEHVVGIDRTFLPWTGHSSGKKLKTTYLWPLIDPPHMDIRPPRDVNEDTPLFRDDALAGELAPGGRLDQLVSLGSELPVTWVVDPQLLASVDAMTKPYKVVVRHGGTTSTVNGTGTQDARQWLDKLQQAVAGGEVVALPFGDPDIASIAHDGRSVPGTIAHLQSATELAAMTVDTILDVTPRTDFAWPVDGAVDPSIVATAAAGGADTVIARSDSFSESTALPYTPSAVRPIGDGHTAVVADAALSTAFTGPTATAAQATAAVQRFLAQSLVIRDQQPQLQRSVVVAPQRMPSATQAQAMSDAIKAATAGGWTQAVGLGAAVGQTPDRGANHSVPGSYPRSLRRKESTSSAFRQIQLVQGTLNSFLPILSRGDRVVTPFGNAVLSAMSTEWRGHGSAAQAFRDDTSSYLGELTNDVHIINKQSITLSGRSATIPVTVQNSLNQRVSGLRLRLVSSQANRLDPGAEQVVDIDGGHNRSLKFQTTASANGWTFVTAQLYTQNGTPYGRPMRFRVDVTSITDTVMLVIAVGLLLLVLAGIRMYRQRKRNALRDGDDGPGTPDADTAAAQAEEPAEESGAVPVAARDEEERSAPTVPGARDGKRAVEQPGGAVVPGQAGDPAPDTAADGAEPPVPGEKVER